MGSGSAVEREPFAAAASLSPVADAILDRLVHAAHRIELRSPESMRKEYSALNHDGQSVE
jgi:hypothetical protein